MSVGEWVVNPWLIYENSSEICWQVLLFSQWTKQLDILQDICYIRDYKYSRIDGDMKFAERQIQVSLDTIS